MKISLLIAAIIVGLAALFGVQQKETITRLTTEWEALKTSALDKKIPTDPQTSYSTQRIRSDSARAAREKAINDFASDLAAFGQKMEAARKGGKGEDAEMQKEIVGILDKLTNMSPGDLKSLVKALSADTTLKKDAKRELIMMSIMMLSSDNPEAALALISESSESLGLEGSSRHMLPMILSQYATKDPNGAADWLTENEELLGDKAEEMKKQLVTTLASQDLNSALAMIDTLKLGETDNVYAFLASGVKAGNQDDFLKALDSKNLTEVERQAAIGSLANSPLIREDFKAATTWLDSPELSAKDKESLIQNLHYHIVKDSAQEWLGWIEKQEDKSIATEQATRQILSGWTQDNFVEAGEWLQSQEAGPTKDTAIKTYAETLAPHEPAAAADWAGTLPEGQERTRLLQNIHSSLKEKDPEAATALAEKYGLETSDN